ncbi:hypothetical protein [Candidatus Avelusimicrobium luingense]|uniref:hypothetical protein n=1 Tax=Candidatus Avelusimicrobium luingense TaxID=3416211 RepID=UPI003D0ACDA3
MKKIFCLFVSLICLGACSSGLKTAVKDGKIAPSFNDMLLTNDYLWVRGLGAVNPAHTSDSQRRIMSREAAIAHAYQRATEILYGAQLDSHVQVVDAVSVGSTVETSAQGLIQHMELISTEYLDDGGCSVIMRVNRAALKQAGIEPEQKK